MANIKVIFQGTERSKTNTTELEVYATINNEISIVIESEGNYPSLISLDKATAVRLVRELKKEIGNLNLNF